MFFFTNFAAHVSAHLYKAMLQLLPVACEGGPPGPGLATDGDVAGQPHEGVGDKEAGKCFFSYFSIFSIFINFRLNHCRLGMRTPWYRTTY